MTLGPSNPAWKMLRGALEELTNETGAAGAVVIDDGNGLWCASNGGFDAAADRFYREEIATRPEVQLRRGTGLHVVRAALPEHAYIAESFASIYVVIVFFDREFDPFTNRTRVRDALERIERLTLALPPPKREDA